VRGLSITAFQQWGIQILSTGGNAIQANYIGLEPDGVTANGNGLGGGGGISIYEVVQGNIVGGTLPDQRNIISGNNGYGIWAAFGSGSNVISGNFIGTDSTGTVPVGNDDAGILLVQNNGNVIGGTAVGAGNVISDNSGGAIYLALSQDNTVQGNLIGTDVTGSSALGNGYWGISLQNANANVIGGNIPAARNVISANNGGILLDESTHSNTVKGNYIGTDHSGLLPLGNASAGILAFRSSIPDGGATPSEAPDRTRATSLPITGSLQCSLTPAQA